MIFIKKLSSCFVVLMVIALSACTSGLEDDYEKMYGYLANPDFISDDGSATSSTNNPVTSKSSSSRVRQSSSSANAGICAAENGVKVISPILNSKFKVGDTISVVYGSDVAGSGYRFVYKTSESDPGVDLLDASAGPTNPDGKTCYVQKIFLSENVVTPSKTAVIRVVPYEKTAKAANSETFVVEGSSNVVVNSSSSGVPGDGSDYNAAMNLLTDFRDGQVYRTVTINTQIWMGQNLNYDYNVGSAQSSCYNKSADYCTNYGRLYSWSAAMDSAAVFSTSGAGCGSGKSCNPSGIVRGACPKGWHLPNDAEWNVLINYVGVISTGGMKLKSNSGWAGASYNGYDNFNFTILPSGMLNNTGVFSGLSYQAYFWTSNEGSSNYASYWYFISESDEALHGSKYKNFGYSVRCLKD